MNLQPLRDKILVRPEKRNLSDVLFIQSAEADSRGTVIAVGPDAQAEGLNVGDKITFGTYHKNYKDEYLKFEEIKHNDERLLKMSWQDVCFVMEE